MTWSISALAISLSVLLAAPDGTAPAPAPVAAPAPAPVAAPAPAAASVSATPAIEKVTHEKPSAIKLGLSAPLDRQEAQKDGAAVAAALTKAFGREVQFEVLKPNELAAQLADGRLDIGWLTALEYIEAARISNGKVEPVAKALHAGLPFYRSVLFTLKKNKSINTPVDLKGKKLAFVADTSSAGYVVPHQMLLEAGLTNAEIKAQSSFLGDHAGVCRVVLDGDADAGATISNDRAGDQIAGCAETLGKDVSLLKVLSTSDPIPNDVFALKPGSTPEEFAQLRAALLDLGKSEAGKKLLTESLHADAFAPADDGDFSPLRSSLK